MEACSHINRHSQQCALPRNESIIQRRMHGDTLTGLEKLCRDNSKRVNVCRTCQCMPPAPPAAERSRSGKSSTCTMGRKRPRPRWPGRRYRIALPDEGRRSRCMLIRRPPRAPVGAGRAAEICAAGILARTPVEHAPPHPLPTLLHNRRARTPRAALPARARCATGRKRPRPRWPGRRYHVALPDEGRRSRCMLIRCPPRAPVGAGRAAEICAAAAPRGRLRARLPDLCFRAAHATRLSARTVG
jgi:hypothetical protein